MAPCSPAGEHPEDLVLRAGRDIGVYTHALIRRNYGSALRLATGFGLGPQPRWLHGARQTRTPGCDASDTRRPSSRTCSSERWATSSPACASSRRTFTVARTTST